MIKKTALYDSHIAMQAKMGPFAGYDMPLYYDEGVMKEHIWVRENAGLFDVSHMGQVIIEGADVVQYLERITPSGFVIKKHGRAQYTVLTNEQGGIIDDLIITRLTDDKFFAVINAGCKDKDITWMRENLPDGLNFTVLDDRSLIALQGPKAEAALLEVMEYDAKDMGYMTLVEAVSPCGRDIYISRLGYTGEDGFEISVPNEIAMNVWNGLCGYAAVKPIGLAARDSLRLEMGYPLYGHDIDVNTSPVEASIGWIISKKNNGFIGADRILREREKGASRKRVGIKLIGKGVARQGAELRNLNDEKIGDLTSGGFSPTLNGSIGQGYVPVDMAKDGTKIFVNVRGRNIEAEITSMPFVPPSTKAMNTKKAA